MNDFTLVYNFFFNILGQIFNLFTSATLSNWVLAIPIVYFLWSNVVYLMNKVRGKR